MHWYFEYYPGLGYQELSSFPALLNVTDRNDSALNYNWATTWQNQQSDWAPSEDSSAQSDQSLRCPHEKTLGL